ncbi:MAG: hypothetical protein OEN21_14735 [Myxococcales bacterium]|nr:hypothetical protein [Myxococcales bacterium]
MRDSRHSVSMGTFGLAFAIVLSPALMQYHDRDSGCTPPPVDTRLSELAVIVDELDRIAFDSSQRAYDDIWLPESADSALVRAIPSDLHTRVTVRVYHDLGSVQTMVAVYGGGEAITPLEPGLNTIEVVVMPPGGSGYYTIDLFVGPHPIPYDRTDPSRTAPFPDDYWLMPDASTATGFRVEIPVPAQETDVQALFLALLNETYSLDGFSPIGGIVIELPEAPDANSLPMTPAASLDPSASMGLFDLTPGSPSLGDRVPFQLSPVSRTLPGQSISHSLVLYPSIPLSPSGRYGMVVTRGALGSDGVAFGPSAFLKAVLLPASVGEDSAITKARGVLEDGLLDVLSDPQVVSPPITADEIALALRISVRSTDDIPLTPLAMKNYVLQAPPPAYQITSITPTGYPLAADVRGTWEAPNWRDGYFLSRDANGDPVVTGTQTIDFVLALPDAALSGPVPVVMYQHGSPGSSDEAISQALGGLAEAGFAVIGFTDTLNREAGSASTADHNRLLFLTLLAEWRYPNFAMQTYGEQMAFLRVIEQLDTLDVVPLPNGDGIPDLDLGASLNYVGISMGSVHGSGFLPYAPEIRAAALAVGAKREAESYFGGGAFIDIFPPDLRALIPNLKPVDYWVSLGIMQMIFDHQDPHNHAAFFYDNPIEVAGTTRKASVLITEGVGDTIIPNNATRSLAWTMGAIPHLEPVQQATPILQSIAGPVTGNIDSETTAAFYQFVPAGIPGIPPSPGCEFVTEGHSCAQGVPTAYQQRVSFLRSAADDAVPTIVDPLAPAP